MSGRDDRQRRDLNLLMKSYRALEAEQDKTPDEEPPVEQDRRRRSSRRRARRSKDNRSSSSAPSSASSSADAEGAGDEDVVMYRGRPVRRGGMGTPGAGSSQGGSTGFRGSGGKSGGRNRRSDGGGSTGSKADRIKQALATLAEMYEEGMITKSEYDAKRRQLLNRL